MISKVGMGKKGRKREREKLKRKEWGVKEGSEKK